MSLDYFSLVLEMYEHAANLQSQTRYPFTIFPCDVDKTMQEMKK